MAERANSALSASRLWAIEFSNGWQYTPDQESADDARARGLPVVEYVTAERLGEAEEALDEMRLELAAAEPILVAADRVREACDAVLEGRDPGRLPDWEAPRAA